MSKKTKKLERPSKSAGASGKQGYESQKENPFTKFECEMPAGSWFDGYEDRVIDFALFMLNGYIWEARNGDRFIAHHSELHDVERIRDRLANFKSEHWTSQFWPQEDEMKQLALIDFIRILPYMWD